MIQTPYLLFLGDAPDQLAAKVAQGITDWRPENAVGQFRMPGCGADMGIADMTLEDGLKAGAKTLVIGVANRGGVISQEWQTVLVRALQLGYDIAAGLDKDLLQKLIDEGMEVNEVDTDAFVEASKPIYDEFAQSVDGAADLIGKAQELAQ